MKKLTRKEIYRRLRAAAKAARIDRGYGRQVQTKVERNDDGSYTESVYNYPGDGEWGGNITLWSNALRIAQPGDELDVAVYEMIPAWGGGFEEGDLLYNVQIEVGTADSPCRFKEGGSSWTEIA